MGNTTHNIAIVPTIIAKLFGFGNHFIWKRHKNTVEKIMYTFSHFCAIITLQCAGWADPGKLALLDGGLIKIKKMQARFLIGGGSGPKNRKDGCLLVMPLWQENTKGVYTFG